MTTTFKKTVSFCVGTGRCGTTLIARLAGLEPDVAASHERLRLAACYHMFCKWQGIPCDSAGFLAGREAAVREDHAEQSVSFESSALLSHSIAELYDRFDARFLLLVRRPDHTVASFAVRRWFVDPIAWNDPSVPPTLPEGVEPRHFFGRNLPRGQEFFRWRALTQIGKLAWWWQARNRSIVEQFADLPKSRRHIVRLEDFDHQRYARVAEFLGWTSTVTADQFAELSKQRPNAGPNVPRDPAEWSATEIAEFEAEVAVVARALGYEHRIAALLAGAAATPPSTDGPAVTDVLAALKAS